MPIQTTIGIGECAVTRDPAESLVTYALGSCIAVSIYDPVAGVGGLLHFLLPESSIGLARGKDNPCMFADTGVPILLEKAQVLGAMKPRMIVRIAGGAQVLDDAAMFNIGKRNHLGLRKVLWKLGVLVHGEAVGGTVSRSVRLDMKDGRFSVREGTGAARDLPLRAVAAAPSAGKGQR